METLIKRLNNELRLIKKSPIDSIDAYPEEKDMLTWYFLIKGASDSDYKDGCYIGKLLLTKDYPYSSIDVIMLTPSGRFDIGKKICLSNTNYHPESKSVMWNIKTFLMGFLSIMNDDVEHGLNHLKESSDKKKQYAKDSFDYNVKYHFDIFKEFSRFIKMDDKKNLSLI